LPATGTLIGSWRTCHLDLIRMPVPCCLEACKSIYTARKSANQR
jgi:hypothetical protein